MSAPTQHRPGLYKPDSIIDVADSLGITNLSEPIAGALASDVEYRLHQIIEEASRFTRHSRRTTMTVLDVENALKTLNIEPVYGYSSSTPMSFKKIHPGAGAPIYVVDDEEIDLETILNEKPVPVPRAARYTAHWLAIEGVQPLIPENPPPDALSKSEADGGQASTNGVSGRHHTNGVHTPTTAVDGANAGGSSVQSAQQALTAKTHLSRELQHYYQRLVSSLVPASEERKRTAAITSLRADAGLAPVLPYIARWVAEGVVGVIRDGDEGGEGDIDRKSLSIYMDVIAALLENDRLFVEPYLHQFLPPILSILLTSTLYISSPLTPTPTEPTPSQLRLHASSVLSRLLTLHGSTYPSLTSRVTKTLLAALVEPGRVLGTREGALRGLSVGAIGKEAVLRGLVKAGGAKVVEDDVRRAREMGIDTKGLEDAMMDALEILCPRYAYPTAPGASNTNPGTTTSPSKDTSTHATTAAAVAAAVISHPSAPVPLNDMDDDDRDAAKLIADTFGSSSSTASEEEGGGGGSAVEEAGKEKGGEKEEFSFASLIVKDGAWAKGLAKVLSEQQV